MKSEKKYKRQKVTASAPGKLMLFGEHAVVYGIPSIVTAVDQRISVEVEKNGVDAFHLEAPDLGLAAYSKTIGDLGKKQLPKAVRFIEMFYKRFLDKYPQKEGIDVTTRSDFSASYGFGSSSAVTVAFAKALTSLYGIELSKKDLFNLCYQTVIDVQGVGSGFDIATAIWGGTIYYVAPAKVVEVIEILDLPIVVGYTGVKADTPTLIRMVQGLRAKNKKKIENIFNLTGEIVNMARVGMERGDWELVGGLMKKNQKLLRKLQVSSVELEDLIKAAEKSGAYGAKLSGAGGGDCMVAVVSGENKDGVERGIGAVGGGLVRVVLGAEGVRIEG